MALDHMVPSSPRVYPHFKEGVREGTEGESEKNPYFFGAGCSVSSYASSRWGALCCILALPLLCSAAGSADPSLSPASWPLGDLDKYTLLTTRSCYPTCVHPLANSSFGVIAGSTNALAVHSGEWALQQGGTAMDACLATAAAQVVLAGGAYVSLAGAGLLRHNAD